MNKQKISIIVLSLIVIAFSIYTAKNIFDSYSLKVFESGYSNGYVKAVEEVITSAKDEACNAFSVYNNDEEVNLINIDCLYGEEPEQE
ncbi:MAG: hypothetical protein WC446_01205 [Candidatus Paceibacterota bacterium]|jgi:uncharacterized protein YpmB